ncbi:uncharacterized protein TNCT_130461 [Trichonephila clavata]|uniref:Uncharacterized protein n=1 Tax=Trichonephila clavata TaxID=2740835 RepID=A0A8X6GTL5_TRICU|nr:uncharacterized protein TNCT_130461 [Trichonephila clavata]
MLSTSRKRSKYHLCKTRSELNSEAKQKTHFTPTEKVGAPSIGLFATLGWQLKNLRPIQNASPQTLSKAFLECNRRLQALGALGEKIDNYGRVLVPKILRVFPDEIVKKWIIHTKRQSVSEGNVTKIMEFLSNEVEGALTALKTKGDTVMAYLPPTTSFHVNTKRTSGPKKNNHIPFVNRQTIGLRNVKLYDKLSS